MAFSVSDVRGLSTMPQVKINGEPRDIIAGSGITALPNGVRVLIHSDEFLQGLLYLILQAETFALLSGTLLMFVTLAALMVATRHIDWQQLMAKNSNPDALS